jgi:multisubunit Na+/H+ antiporter MnhB subunit
VQPLLLVGVGLAIAVAVALTPLLFGDALLESATVKWDLPILGDVKLVSSSLFDVGVMVLVTGVVLAALAAFVRAGDAGASTAGKPVGRDPDTGSDDREVVAP